MFSFWVVANLVGFESSNMQLRFSTIMVQYVTQHKKSTLILTPIEIQQVTVTFLHCFLLFSFLMQIIMSLRLKLFTFSLFVRRACLYAFSQLRFSYFQTATNPFEHIVLHTIRDLYISSLIILVGISVSRVLMVFLDFAQFPSLITVVFTLYLLVNLCQFFLVKLVFVKTDKVCDV